MFDQLLESPIRKKAASRCKENIKRCKDCIWRGLCGGLCYSADYYSGIKEEDETEVCSFYKKIIPYLIGRIAEDPNIPYLVDREFEETKWRNIFISLGSSNNEVMDEELFRALLKVHNINNKCMLQICINKISECADFSKILDILKETDITCNLITNDEDLASSDTYDLLANANVQAVQVDFAATDGNANPLIKKFTECRKGKECKIPLYVSLVHSPDSLEKTLSDLENLELGENDRIILSNSSDTEKGYEALNILLITLNERGLSKQVKLSHIGEDKLWKKNLVFLLNGTNDNETSCLQIGLDCLAGKTLEQAPPNIL